jgi:hypothetical protein
MSAKLTTGLIHAFKAIRHALDLLCLHIHDDLKSFPLWLANSEEVFTQDRDKAIFVLTKFTPTPGLNPQETYSCPGVIGGNAQTLEYILHVNQAKDSLLHVVSECHSALKGDVLKFIRETLAQAGFGTVKLKEAYRHIKYINGHPHRIAWSRGLHSSHKSLSKKASETLLNKMGAGEHIDIQLAKLAMLGDATLIQYRRSKSLWVANFTLKTTRAITQRGLLRTGLPIFYLHNAELAPPVVCFSDKRPRVSQNLARKKLETEAFLPSISAYRKLK